ncbi:MAG: LacI family transcriptional regulator [Clostridiales bacterium]|jgi:DNA-binding LacI/PurR family transcriptional regulator|nr:LacI family transcriptional regulator [Clostridiales bacterium]
MTMNDVSDHIGVSIATISRVLNNSGIVKPKTREKVMNGIRELDFVPSSLGRNLRTTGTKTFLICVQSIENPYYAEIVRSIEEEAKKRGYYIMICESYSSLKRYKYFADAVKSKKADGIILLSPNAKDAIEYFREAPFVVCGETDGTFDCDTVNIDNEKAACEAVEHLIRAGAKRVAFMGGDSKSALQRFAGYEKALREANLPSDETLRLSNLFSYDEGYAAVSRLAESGAAFDGIFAGTDILAVSAVNALIAQGKRVPEDVKVVGFDDLVFAKMCAVPITTIRQPRKAMGAAAFNLLYEKAVRKTDDKNKARDSQRIVLEHELIVRSSSK